MTAVIEAGNNVYLGRQAIFDRRANVAAYELLYRDSNENAAKFTDNTTATRTTIINALTEFGLDAISDEKDVFINFSPESLTDNFAQLLPRERTVIEVLETVVPDDPTVMVFEKLKGDGCRLALDDFVFEDRYAPLLKLADIVKVDLRMTPQQELERHVQLMRDYDITLLAEKVETQEEMDRCVELGFELFQGWFYCRPQVMVGRSLPADRSGTLRLVAELQKPDLPLDEIAALISQDPGLSVKLLKYINSAHVGLTRKVESIKHAASLVGRQRLRIWGTLLGLGGLTDKPRELLVAANIRGRMCDRIGSDVFGDTTGAYFTVGMFSLLDAMLDIPLEELVRPLPLSEAVLEALLHGTGTLGLVLNAVKSWEMDQVDSAALESSNLSPLILRDSYKGALLWTRDMMKAMGV